MSIEATSWALNVPIGGNAKVILLGLANHAHADGSQAFPAVDTLARYAHCDRRTVQRNLRQLEAEGWIVPDGSRSYKYDEKMGRGLSVYTLPLGRQSAAHPVTEGAALVTDRGGTDGTKGAALVPPNPSIGTVKEPSPTVAPGAQQPLVEQAATPVMQVWNYYVWKIDGGERRRLGVDEAKIIEAALKVRSFDQVCRAIDGLAVSDFHNGRSERSDGRKFLGIRYALHGNRQRRESVGDRIDAMADVAASATSGNGRVIRLEHSTADLSIYDSKTQEG